MSPEPTIRVVRRGNAADDQRRCSGRGVMVRALVFCALAVAVCRNCGGKTDDAPGTPEPEASAKSGESSSFGGLRPISRPGAAEEAAPPASGLRPISRPGVAPAAEVAEEAAPPAGGLHPISRPGAAPAAGGADEAAPPSGALHPISRPGITPET